MENQNQEQQANMFNEPGSFVPQSLRQFDTKSKYFSTSGVDVYGRPTKLYFTMEERNYLTQNGITAQEFYDKFQSKLGGNFVPGMPKKPGGMTGPEYSTPSSFVPADMRRFCPERGYQRFVIKDELGLDKEVFFTQEELNFINMNGIDMGTYVNVYQKEFDYDKGQMDMEATAQMQQELQMEKTPNGAAV